MLPELHPFSKSLEVEAKVRSPKYGQRGDASSWASLPEDVSPASHFPPEGPGLGRHFNIQRSCSLGGVWAGASPA